MIIVQVCEPYDYEVVDLLLGLWPDGPDSLLKIIIEQEEREKVIELCECN